MWRSIRIDKLKWEISKTLDCRLGFAPKEFLSQEQIKLVKALHRYLVVFVHLRYQKYQFLLEFNIMVVIALHLVYKFG